MIRKLICVLMLFLMICSCAMAEQEVMLPGGHYALDVPDWMEYSDAVDGDAGVEAYISEDLEMDFVSYLKETALEFGMPGTLKETAKEKRAEGIKVEIRKINGIEMLLFRVQDEEDDAQGIVYVFEDGELIIEINFWYSTQEAADETKTIMETIRENNS